MEKLTSKKFDKSQIISSAESQHIFGGRQINTRFTGGGWSCYDVFRDNNNDGWLNSGDVLDIFYRQAGSTEGTMPVGQSIPSLQSQGVQVNVIQ